MSAQHILHIAGWSSCGFYKRASTVLASLSLLFPSKVKVVDHEFASRSEFHEWLIDGGFRGKMVDPRAQSQSSSPYVWLSHSDVSPDSPDPLDVKAFIGGHDDTLVWCREFCAPAPPCRGVTMQDDGHTAEHSHDYDLVVIGGGSGGLAASKEASRLGAKVAVLDFVKPSPAGSVWGLGGTCVNVGCIPKKLMHNAAQINEIVNQDTAAFGLSMRGAAEMAPGSAGMMDHTWEIMRENVQNYIRGLNFKYRVNLREKNVKYLNKLGRFLDPHTIEVVDKKGKKETITSSRFIVAVGGRPAPLDCEGGDLAITSDDIFSLDKDPGKVLCVGASYISLECAGFLAGLGYDTTVAVRSILLRGFDRECADRIGDYMEAHNVKFRKGVIPTKLEKVSDSEKIQVTFSDGEVEVFDTVVAAIGRLADTSKLGLEAVGVKANAKNGKISTVHEQTSTPHIYAIGDVMEGCPELTPVAIQSGILLARRLFGNSREPMDYVNICTTVFTPIEYSCVGLSEDDAMQKFGTDNLEVYHKLFMPLEWALSDGRAKHEAFAKVIVDKADDSVLGIHYVGPNAGEVMQGYGVSMRRGLLKFKDLEMTVGIHPTTSEELVTMSITKSSGEDASAGAC